METVSVPSPVFVEVRDSSHVGEARRHSAALATACGMDETGSAVVGIIATELAGNLARYAVDGLLVSQWLPAGCGGDFEILSIDRGPGIADVGECLRDGYTTGRTPGTGLGAIRRLSSEFDIHSVPAQGTIIVSRVTARAPGRIKETSIRWGALSRPLPGEVACGDLWRTAIGTDVATFMVVDGLGHGPYAAAAAEAMADVFDRTPFATPGQVLETAHDELRGTRGAAVSIAQVDRKDRRIRFAGVGNVVSTIADGETSKGMVSHNGTLGVQVRKIQTFEYEWPAGSLLIMHSDGLQSRWSLAPHRGLQLRHPAVIAAALLRDCSRGHDDVTVLVARLEE